ncbi:NAD(P)-dependent oxidoreductase [Lysobacter sp. BMK333-48F3]|uniref:NAD(P)-dependent oxidoreductase n=1 Tax=Lysobacter sp. BMK333-48F3 TaxID=2867962 RepID=UPI001C8CC45B|nr:NAD(P)-dependent oxidoreductase [Lysobacter sp. BMK333-48F3]MBX9402182.1 NAD(P)-dependent oxidoreductase [Lysobacter sp. BMK333-48F3]
MNLVLIGATGYVGRALLEEALQRGHQVTAVARDPSALPARDGLRLRPGAIDGGDPARAAELVRGADAVIASLNVGGWSNPNLEDDTVAGYAQLVDGLKQAGVPRLLVVGGAGSLEVAPGQQLLDQPGFPDQWRGGAEAMRRVLGTLRDERELDWSFLSPAAHLVPGERTGRFRLGGDQLLVDEQGESAISVQDYALAMIDELEQPAHSRRRFTLAY